jgi:hypothetical protein
MLYFIEVGLVTDAIQRPGNGKEPTIVLRCGQIILLTDGGGEGGRSGMLSYLPGFLAWSTVLTDLASLSAFSCGLSASLSTEVSLKRWKSHDER